MKLGRAALGAVAVLVVGCSSAPTAAVTEKVTVTETMSTTVPTTVVSSATVKADDPCAAGNADAVKVYEDAIKDAVLKVNGGALDSEVTEILMDALNDGVTARMC